MRFDGCEGRFTTSSLGGDWGDATQRDLRSVLLLVLSCIKCLICSDILLHVLYLNYGREAWMKSHDEYALLWDLPKRSAPALIVLGYFYSGCDMYS